MSEFFKGSKKNPDPSKKARRSRMRQERLTLKRKDAAERQTYSDSLSIKERISRLDRKLGIGIGATSERARLLAKLETEMVTKEKKTKTDATLDTLKDSLNEKVQAIVKDVVKVATQAAEEELHKNRKNSKTKSKSKRV